MDSPDIDLSFFMPQKRNKRQSDSGSICGSTTFSSYDFIEKIFKIDVAIVEITKIVQNAGLILAMVAILSKQKASLINGVVECYLSSVESTLISPGDK